VQDDAPKELLEALNPVAEGTELDSPENTGYVVHSLQTALHDAFTASNPEEAIVTAVNRGGDTDTIGAIAGAVAGAKFGIEGFPERWLSALNERQEIDRLATELWDLTTV
jgi:ADP-ribosyl-[dinitrogen reductase] hydrolase